jgi:hypothetical protein
MIPPIYAVAVEPSRYKGLVLPQGRALGKVSIVQSAGYETTDLCTRVDEA